jgi:hypothetical protein
MHLAGIRTTLEQLLNGYPADGVSEVRYEFRQRGEDESSIRVSGMRNNQVFRVNPLILVKEYVEIDGTWPSGLIPNASGFAFNLKTALQ